MSAYYNENDPFAVAWLRKLIKEGLITDGEVDERSITDVLPADLDRYAQCHFFAGIGGWSHALRLARWPDDRPVWTGSCPCQPFSSAGSQTGGDDPRHLWPAWFRLIRECRPDVVFGEQVESAIGHGWLDLVCDDLEGAGYAIGAVGLPGPCIGAYDIRQRLWFVGALDYTEQQRTGRSARGEGREEQTSSSSREDERCRELQAVNASAHAGELANAECAPWRLRAERGADDQHEVEVWPEGASWPGERSSAGGLADIESGGLRIDWSALRHSGHVDERCTVEQLADAEGERLPNGDRTRDTRVSGSEPSGFWRDAEWLPCRDGKARPVESGTFPLASGVSARVGRLRGYGNAIKPQVAQVFIEAYMSL